MSRKHFVALAWELRQAYPQPGNTPATDLTLTGTPVASARGRTASRLSPTRARPATEPLTVTDSWSRPATSGARTGGVPSVATSWPAALSWTMLTSQD